jgi:hypothetical protein
VSAITSNFNGTAIAGGNYIWFSSVGKVSGVASEPVTLRVVNQTIEFTSNGIPYSLSVPDTTITLTPGATSAGATYGPGGWAVSTPGSVSGNVFLSGLGWRVPDGGLAGGSVKSITWQGDFTTTAPGVSVNWKWAAAVYKTFSDDPAQLGVKAVDANNLDVYRNSDHAGTPENFKAAVTGGARGGGGRTTPARTPGPLRSSRR